MKKRSAWIAATLIVVIAAGTWGGFQVYGKKDTPVSASLNSTPVRKGNLEVKISGTGSIQPSSRQTIKASNVGTALKVNYKQGDTVKKGDVLITYVQEDITNQVKSKELDVKKKKLDLADLQKKYKEESDSTLREALSLNVQKQQLDIEMSQQDIASLKSNKKLDPIVAPIDGVLATFSVQAGDSINPNSDLGEIVNFAQLYMVVGVDELDISKVKLDQEAQILVEALPANPFTGKVVSIADEGTTSNGVASYNVTIVLTDASKLKVGMSAEASILTEKKTDALYVPVEAVQSFQGKYFVMIPGTGTSTEGTGTETGAEGSGAEGPGFGSGAGRTPGAGSNVDAEDRAAMREKFMENSNRSRSQGTGTRTGAGAGTRTSAGAGTIAQTGTGSGTAIAATKRVAVEVGINNEDYIEILSGLKEGDLVVLPTLISTSTNANRSTGIMGLGSGGIPGAGGMQGGGGGFNGGGRQFSGGAAGGAR
ncbi:efflux RND transporter periplasmic adaptor subunit [Cohnella abietis]|uniref:Hemolysin D n=1 Tax=Cohnella abietis TaxID=2507935 RepID=A0A3T1D6M0_9BACL|nr:efflux RND transporter periplasmic adaptor subunit [Cohnella abietis]BBI33722.1 hemolysin D [Cohnella abietis]